MQENTKNFASICYKISSDEYTKMTQNSHLQQDFLMGLQQSKRQKKDKWALLSSVSLLPVLSACDGKVVNFDGGEAAPKVQSPPDSPPTFQPDKTGQGFAGTLQADILPTSSRPRDEGNNKLDNNYGGGDDKIFGIGVSEPAQYTQQDLINVANTGTDFSKILYLDQSYNQSDQDEVYTTLNANRLSTVTAGDTINGGDGKDSLYLYGQHNFYSLEEKGKENPFTGELYDAYREKQVVLESVENIYLHGATLIVSAQHLRELSGLKIQGDGQAVVWVKTPADLEKSNESGRFIPRKYEEATEEQSSRRFQLSDIEELRYYIVDLRNADLSGINRLHIDAGTAILLRLDVESEDGVAKVQGVLKDLSMITGRGAVVFDPTGNLEVPNLENLWISKEIEVIIAARLEGSLATRDGSRGGSKEIDDDNLIDTIINDKPFLKLGINAGGASADDTMVGSNGDDILSGNAGEDLLNGGNGDDSLDPGIGKDQIITGAGNDIILGEATSLNGDVLRDFSFTDRVKIIGNYSASNVSAQIVDEDSERRINVDVTGDGVADFYMVLAEPTASENQISFRDRVYNFTDTHFHVIQDAGGVVLVPTKLRDLAGNQKPEVGLVYLEGPYAIEENEVGSLVARIKGIDADSPADGDGRHGYRLVEDDKGFSEKFTVTPTGELRLKNDAFFNFEEYRSVNIFIEVFDNPSPSGVETDSSLSQRQNIQIYVKDINEAPEFTTFTENNTQVGIQGSVVDDGTLATINVVENTTFVLKFPEAIDPDLGDSTNYLLEGRNSDLFVLDSLTQTISFREPANYELRPGEAYQIRLIAVDAGGLQSRKDIEVTVKDVNEAPVEVNPLPVQWVIVGDDSFNQIQGIETIFEDPEYEEQRRLEGNKTDNDDSSGKTLTYSYINKTTGTILPWLSQPEEVGTQRYGMEVDANQVQALYGGSENIYREFEIEIQARDQSGLVGTSSFKLIISDNKPPISTEDSINTNLFLVENGSLDQRVEENVEAVVTFLNGVTDPEGQPIKIRTTIPILDGNGNQIRDGSGNELFQEIYWGKYGYLVIKDVDLTLTRAGGTQPTSQQYSYYLVSDPEDVERAKNLHAELSVTNQENLAYLVDDAFLNALAERVNSLSVGERVDEEIKVEIEDYGLKGDRTTLLSYIEKTVILNVDGTNDFPEKQGELIITVREPGDAYTIPDTENDPSAIASGGIGALTENVRDVDTKDILGVAEAALPERGVGTLQTFGDGRYIFTADHNKDTAGNESNVDKLAEGEVLTYTYKVQVSDGRGGAVTNDVVVQIIGRNDVPVFHQDVLDRGRYQEQDFDNLRFSQSSVHHFALPEGSFLDVDVKDTLTYTFTAFARGTADAAETFEIVDISDWFVLDPNTGAITIDRPPGPSSEEPTVYRITITASDSRAEAQGEFEFAVYKNLPPFHSDNNPGSSANRPALIGKEVFDLTPQEERDVNEPPPIGTTKHIVSGDAFELLAGIEDTTQLSEGTTIRVLFDDPLNEKFENLNIVAGSYVGRYGELVINPKNNGQQTYTYTLDYGGLLTNQLRQGERAQGAESEAIEIQVQDKGGLIGSQWVSFVIEGINDAPESSGEQVYVIGENIGSSAPRVNPLENVNDPDGSVDPTAQNAIYIWQVRSEETGNTESFDRLIVSDPSGNTFNVRPATFEIVGRYGVLEVLRKVENGSISYDTRYLIHENNIEVEKLNVRDSLSERFTLIVADGVLPEQGNAYSAEQIFVVQIAGENDEAEIFVIPELNIERGTSYELNLDSYVKDSDSTKIYRLKSITKDGIEISNLDFLTRSGQIQGDLANIPTFNVLSFSPNDQEDIGSYRLTFTTSNVADSGVALEEQDVVVRLNVVASQSNLSVPPPLDLTGTGVVVESNKDLSTEKVLDYPQVVGDTHRPAEGRYKGTYGYIEVIGGDRAENDSIIYYLDNLDEDTDALSQNQEVVDTVLLDVMLADTNQPRVQQKINILVQGVNDAPVITNSIGLAVNLAVDQTSADIDRVLLSAGIVDPDSTGLRYEFIAFPDDSSRFEGIYGYILSLGEDNYRYVVNPNGDTNLARSRLVKELKQGETVEETFEIEVSDGLSTIFQTLTATIIGKDDVPEIIKKDENNNIILRFLQGESAEKALTGDYVIDPDGDEIQYRQIGSIEKDGEILTGTDLIFDADAGVVHIAGDAEAGEYRFRILIQNPFSLPIDADGNLVRVVVSDATRDNLDLLDEDLTSLGTRPLEILEGIDGAESLPIQIAESFLIETKDDRFGFNPKPVAVDDARSAYGRYSIDEFTGNLIYRLDNTNLEVNKLDRNEELFDSITYAVVDDYGTRDERTIKIAIIGENDSTTVALRDLKKEGLLIEQHHNTATNEVAFERWFQNVTIEISDPETDDDFGGKELILTMRAEVGVDDTFLDGFRFLLPSSVLDGGIVNPTGDFGRVTIQETEFIEIQGDEARFQLGNGTTKINIINFLQTSLNFRLESAFAKEQNGELRNGNGYVTSGTNARFEGLSLNVNLSDGSSNSIIRLLDTAGNELLDGSEILRDIPVTVTLEGFNRFVFDATQNFTHTITPDGLIIAFDGENYQLDQLTIENNGLDANPFEIVSIDTNGDDIPDRFVLRSRDIGGTEYIARTLQSGGVLGDGATRFMVSIKDTLVSDVRDFVVTYDALPEERVIITKSEISPDGNVRTFVEQADDVADLRWTGSGSLDRYRIFTGGGDDDLYDHGDLQSNLTNLFAFSNTIFMGAGSDAVFGGAASDDLHGGSGNDTLRGGSGDDRLVGGRGRDIYEWSTQDTDATLHDIVSIQPGSDATSDKIIGFSVVENDEIDLTNITFTDATGTELTGQGTILIGTDYIRIAPGVGTGGGENAPTTIYLDINGDSVIDQRIELWNGEIGTALGLEIDQFALTPDLTVPAFGEDIKLPDVFAYAVLRLTPENNVDTTDMTRLQVLNIEALMNSVGNFNFGTSEPIFEVLGTDKDLFTVDGTTITMDAVSSVEYTRENYLLLVRGEQQTSTGETAVAYGTVEVNFTELPEEYSIYTAGMDKVLTPDVPLSERTALDYILFEGDDIFGTAYKGVHRGINANNHVYAGAGDDIVHTGDGGDSLYGGSGDDTLWSGLGNDVLEGGFGDDVLVMVGGRNKADGGAGNDTIWVSSTLWTRENEREILSQSRVLFAETSVQLGDGEDQLWLFRDGPILVKIEDDSFSRGDNINLSHYVVLPDTGTAILHLSSYIKIDTTRADKIVLYIDKEGLGNFVEPSLADTAFTADAQIEINGRLENGILRSKDGDTLNLGVQIGTTTYDLNEILDTSEAKAISASLRDDGNNNYTLFVAFSEDIAFGSAMNWRWQMNLRSATDDTLIRNFSSIGNDRFSKPQSTNEMPEGMDVNKTLSWGFTSQQSIESIPALKLDVVTLSQNNVDFASVSDFRVNFSDADKPFIEFDDLKNPLKWGLDANDPSQNTINPQWDVNVTILDDEAFQRYEIWGQYSDLFVYEDGKIKRSSASFDVEDLDRMPRELHFTLVAYNERGKESRVDFIIERELPTFSSTSSSSYEEDFTDLELIETVGTRSDENFDVL